MHKCNVSLRYGKRTISLRVQISLNLYILKFYWRKKITISAQQTQQKSVNTQYIVSAFNCLFNRYNSFLLTSIGVVPRHVANKQMINVWAFELFYMFDVIVLIWRLFFFCWCFYRLNKIWIIFRLLSSNEKTICRFFCKKEIVIDKNFIVLYQRVHFTT